MSCFVFRPSTRGRTSRFYSAKIKIEGMARPRVIALRTGDKEVAREKARSLVNDMEREALGLPSYGSLRKASASPIASHLTAFLADVEARGGARATLRVYRVVLGQLVRCCGWSSPGRITSASFNRWRADTGASAKYAKNAMGYARTFCRWLVKRRALAVDPFDGCEIRIRQDRGSRYVPSLERLNAFLEGAPHKRAVVYLVAVYTGLRRFELNGLTWGDLDLDTGNPSVLVPGSISKNAKTERDLCKTS